jgi:hypothetical protein
MTFAFARHVRVTETDSGMVVLDERSGRYWALNATAATVVRCLLSGRTAEEAIRALSESFPSDADRIAADVDAFLRSLTEAEVIIP